MGIVDFITKKAVESAFNDAVSKIRAGKGEQVMKSWLPTILIILSSVVSAVSPVVQHFFSAHTTVASIIAGVVGVAAHLLPSPVSTNTN